MYISLQKFLTIAGILSISLFSFAARQAPPVNEKCPFSGKAVKADKVLTFNVCCGKCAKKASSDLKAFVKKVKAGNKECPFSKKPANKMVLIGFCCSSCVDKASS